MAEHAKTEYVNITPEFYEKFLAEFGKEDAERFSLMHIDEIGWVIRDTGDTRYPYAWRAIQYNEIDCWDFCWISEKSLKQAIRRKRKAGRMHELGEFSLDEMTAAMDVMEEMS